MAFALLLRVEPDGPWRLGPSSGQRDQVDLVLRSDTVFAAVSAAMAALGRLEEWLAATAARDGSSAVRFTSGFPWRDDILWIAPPRHLWPPPAAGKLRAKGARFIPVPLAAALVAGAPFEEDAWGVDGESGCLLPREYLAKRGGPFRIAVRAAAAVDRVTAATAAPHLTACLEFAESAGFWLAAEFASKADRDLWLGPLEAAFRLLADSGIGGERSRGWGRFRIREMRSGELPGLVLPEIGTPSPDQEQEAAATTAWWLLSLYSPSPGDSVHWRAGCYSLLTRGGRVESPAGWGVSKKRLRMIEEGSVLVAPSSPLGKATNVAPDGFPHPVYRAGFAVAIPVPWRGAS